MSIVAAKRVHVVYGATHALDDVDITIDRGSSVALVGRSGSGKTTLLHVLAGLVKPTRGIVESHGATAVVFQSSNLIPQFNALENVAFSSAPGVDVERLLALVGLGGKLDHLPEEMSGGEAQRTAIARALAQGPDALLCDEPTGPLDSDTSARVLDLIEALRRELGFAVVMATHDADVAARFATIVELHDGRIVV